MWTLTMELAEELVQCQNVLYKGFTTVEESGIEWLNSFCGGFLRFCNKLHKFLVFDCGEKTVVLETCLLCMTQVISCIKYLEKTIRIESTENIIMSSSRQYFLDRILWCFAHLKSTLNTAQDDIIVSGLVDSNFVTSMDNLVALIEPYSEYNKEDIQNVAQFNAQAIFDSQKIRSALDLLLSQTLAFANVALENDKVALTAICQKVLRECIAFQDTCSIDNEALRSSDHERQFKATVFENSLYQLEDIVNESLLRLVFQVMVDSSQYSVDSLRKLIDSNASSALDDKIADFDVNVDRILQIGIFAMALSVDVKARTTVRSCLASLESLDSFLIPSLYTKDDFHSTLLEDHYLYEIQRFHTTIQSIIDTGAFCKCYEEILYDCIQESQKRFDKIAIGTALEKAKILNEHFEINANDLFSPNYSSEPDQLRDWHGKFDMMLNECLAILACADQVDSLRILKRLNILRSTVKKLMDSLGNRQPAKDMTDELSIVSRSKAYAGSDMNFTFESFGIQPSTACVFYKSRRNRNLTDSMKANTSKLSSVSERTVTEISTCPSSYASPAQVKSPKIKKRVSLRVKMFKRQKSSETQYVRDACSDQSTNLHISEILDQITNLSSTFTKLIRK